LTRIALVLAVSLALSAVGTAGTAAKEPVCATPQLHIWVTRTGVAAGTVGGYLAFKNRGPRACRLRGWPTLTALRPGASTTAKQVRETMFGPYVRVHGLWKYVHGVPIVRLRHGQTAVAAFTGTDVAGPGETTCPPPYRQFRVTPPGNRVSALTRAWIAYYGHYMPSCAGIEVSMVVPVADMPPRG
jgi:hypothetical protein